MPSSRLSALCDKIIEAGWLTALVITPLFFNMDSRRGFEADKVSLLRSIAIVMAVAWLVQWIEQRRSSRPSTHPSPRSALVLPTLVFSVVYLLTTITSVAPRISFWGSYTRLQGTYTTLSYILVFLMLLHGLRTRRQLDRLICAVILSSVPVALYTVIQYYSLDPLWGLLRVSERVFATMSNAIHLAAYLVLAFFFTLAKIADSVRTIRGNAKVVALNLLRLAVYVCTAATQIVAIVLANSRGPFLGLLGGLALFAMLLAFVSRQRKAMLALGGLGVSGVVFLLAVNLPNSPLAALRAVPQVGRLVSLASNPGDSADARLLIWEGNANLVRPHEPLRFPEGSPDSLNSIRPLVGYGPETMYLVYGQSFPPALALVYAGDTLVGRSHNETWDWFVNSGILGVLAYQLLFLSIFLYGLGWIGMMPTPRARNLFVGLWIGLGTSGGLAAILLGEPKYLGIAVPAGTVAAIGLHLMICAVQFNQDKIPTALSRADQVLLAIFLAAVVSHYVEIQFAFGVASTRLLFWICAGMLVVIGSGKLAVEPASTDSEARSTPWISNVASYAMIVGIILATLLHEFVTNYARFLSPLNILWSALTYDSLRNEAAYAILGMVLLTWGLALVATFAEITRAGMFKSFRSGLAAFGLFAALSLGVAIAFGLGRAGQLSALAQMLMPLPVADGRVGLFDYYTLSLLLLLLLIALALVAEHKQLVPVWVASRWSPVALAGLIAVGSVSINMTNLDPVRADMIINLGREYDLNSAILLYARALARVPLEDVYYRAIGRAFVEKASLAGESSASLLDAQTPVEKILRLDASQTTGLSRSDSFYAARAALTHARELNPLNADHTASLALLYNRWASVTTDPALKSRLIEQSNQYYAQAIALRRVDVSLWNAWASLDVLRNDPESALQKLAESLTLNAKHAPTWLLLGRTYAGKRDWQQAADAYRTALALQPNLTEAQRALAELD